MNEDFDLEKIKKLISYGEENTEPVSKASGASVVRHDAEAPRHYIGNIDSVRKSKQVVKIIPGTQAGAAAAGENSVVALRSEDRKTGTMAFSVPFLICLAILSLLSWCIPLRPSVSYKENRNLTAFPEFSFSSLLSGDFFSGIDDWFSDTFPFRDSWITLGNDIESLYGKAGIAIVGAVQQTESVSSQSSESPEKTDSYDISADEVQPYEEAENISSATESSEEANPGVETEEEHKNSAKELDEVDVSNDLAASATTIVLDGSVYPIGLSSEYCSSQFAELMNTAAELLDGKARVFVMPAFQSTSIMLSRSVRDYCQCPADEDSLQYIYSLLNDDVYPVNTYEALVNHNDEYLYFHSDHHWTALGAYYAYLGWAEVAGVEPVTLDNYVETDTGDYTGGYYGYSTKQHPVDMDRVFTYTPPGDISLKIIDSDTSDSLEYRGFDQALLTTISGNGTYGKYSTFLAGDHAMCTLINNDIEDESAILIVKDSYGNPLGYYFTQHYKYVYLIDYRTYLTRRLTGFVDYYNVDDVLFTMNIYMTQTDDGVACMRSFVR